jgi:high-affinity Fe2+/Pb2+ permease
MVVPVLGTVNTITTRRQQTRALVVRGVLAGATLSFVGTFAYVIWAWSSRPELLSESLLESIQDLREALK